MKTAVQMRRELFGTEVRQKSDSEFFSVTDLVRSGNKWRVANGMSPFNLSAWLSAKGTKEFISELEVKFDKVISKGRGRNSCTWVHPLLFIDCALAISPKLKIETYEWLFDNLIKNRNESGDSYKRMSGALYAHSSSKKGFYVEIQNTARLIRAACGCKDWESATEEQLSKRDKIQEAIALLSDVLRDNTQAVRLGLNQYSKLGIYGGAQ
jgi:hypothetical protein